MNHKSVFVLGRQPAIGRAELESLFGAEHLEPIGEYAVASDIPIEDVPFDRIGSSVRLARPLGTLNMTRWSDIARHIAKELPRNLDYIPPGNKVKIGHSVYGLDVTPQQLVRLGLQSKKIAKAGGRSVRYVPNLELTLNSAQVLHNGLTGEGGIETLFLKAGNKTYVAKTVAIQNIDAYAKRDQGRPRRDAFVGMLPPKLAQTIVNLGVSKAPPRIDTVVLDPFCGTGVVLQEALLMGYSAYGTDIDARMVSYSRENLEWLATYGINSTPVVEVGDATQYEWTHPFAVVAGEMYLGQPLSTWPSPEKLQKIRGNCNVIIQKFLSNLGKQIPSGTRLCLAIPAWQEPSGRIHHLPLLDQLEVLGYNRVSFSWAQEQEMVYCRPDQLVARELLVITRK